MANKYTTGIKAIAECDRCGQRYKLKELKELIVRTKKTNMFVCPECWEPDHPQNMQGMYVVEDPQAVRNPRPDNTFGPGGSRDIQWGWNPVGMRDDDGMTPNTLKAVGAVGTVTVTTS